MRIRGGATPVSAPDLGLDSGEAAGVNASGTVGLGLGIADSAGQAYKFYIMRAWEGRFVYSAFDNWNTAAPVLKKGLDATNKLGVTFVLVHEFFKPREPGITSTYDILIDGKRVGVGMFNVEVGAVSINLHANDRQLILKLYEAIRSVYPPFVRLSPEPRVTLSFWMHDPHDGGGTNIERTLDVVNWRDIEVNYPAEVRGAVSKMMRYQPRQSGQLFLWYGPPGTGKTYALRALAWEWRKWCDIYYVTDPATLLSGSPQYMNDILLSPMDMDVMESWYDSEKDDPEVITDVRKRWRLLLLEDAGELLTVTARQEAGPGLGRLLNMADGLIGQGLKFLTLITTNEPLKKLHPAVARPGRCAARIEFGKMGQEDITAWGKSQKLDPKLLPTVPTTVAELYGLQTEQLVVESKEERLGFKPEG